MKYPVLLLVVLFAVPIASAADVEISGSMTLDGNYTPDVVGATAVGHVNVTVVEVPQPPITGFFLTQFDVSGFSGELSSLLSSLSESFFSFFS